MGPIARAVTEHGDYWRLHVDVAAIRNRYPITDATSDYLRMILCTRYETRRDIRGNRIRLWHDYTPAPSTN